jgi:glutathione S-transferase
MSKPTLVIGNKNYSSWSLRPWFFMKQSQIEFEEKRIALYTDTSDRETTAYFSDYKVPVLIDGRLVVWDSLAILEYLSETYLESAGWPNDTEARAIARSVSAEMHSSFISIRKELPMNCRRTFTGFASSANAQKDIQRIKDIWHKCRTEYGARGDWLFGDFSIADAMFAPVVLRFVTYGVELDDLEKAYVDTTLTNPHIIQWMEDGRQEKEIIEASEIKTQN